MSGIGAIHGVFSMWSLAASGVSAIRPIAATTDSLQESPAYKDMSSNRKTVESATITKRMSDGAMVVLSLRGDHVVSSHTYARTGKNLTLSTNYTADQQKRVHHTMDSMDSILAGSFINITA